MADTDWQDPSTGESVPGVNVDWGNPTNIYASDDSRASASLSADESTDYLRATNFGFSIPIGATIDGIEVRIERSKSGSGTIVDDFVKIVKGGSEQGDQNASASEWPSTDAYETYGDSTDLWGLSWTVSDINSSDFGVSIAALEDSGLDSATARVDHIQIKVYYTPGASNVKINISDTFEDGEEIKINIGDSWKTVVQVKQNIGDAWKDVFG